MTDKRSPAAPKPKRLMRSRSVALVTMGVGALALQACSETTTEAAIYSSAKDCITAGTMTKEQCERAFNVARKDHQKVAPKYASKAACEADMGEGKCEVSQYRTSNGGSVFIPLMAGYLMGRALGGPSGVHPQPLYRSRDDAKNFRTADNRKVGSRKGLVRVPLAAGRPPSAKFTTTRRGGFGAAGRSYGRRSFGG